MKLCNVYFGKVSKQNILQVNALYLANINIQSHFKTIFVKTLLMCATSLSEHTGYRSILFAPLLSSVYIVRFYLLFSRFCISFCFYGVLFSLPIMFFTLEGLFLLFSWLFFFLSGVLVVFSVAVVFFLNFCFFFFVLKRFCFGGRCQVFNLQLHF